MWALRAEKDFCFNNRCNKIHQIFFSLWFPKYWAVPVSKLQPCIWKWHVPTLQSSLQVLPLGKKITKALPYFQIPVIISSPALSLSSSQLLHTYKLFKGLEPDIPLLWLSWNASDRLTDPVILLRAEVKLIYISFPSTARLSSRLPFSSSFRSLPDFPKGCLSTFSQLSWTRYDPSVFSRAFCSNGAWHEGEQKQCNKPLWVTKFALQYLFFLDQKKRNHQHHPQKRPKKKSEIKTNYSCLASYFIRFLLLQIQLFATSTDAKHSRCLSKLVFHLNPPEHYILYKIPYHNFC